MCATNGCTETKLAGNSKYCAEHRKAARAAWVSMIQASAEETARKRAVQQAAWDKARKAGSGQATGTLVARPGTTSFARFLAKMAGAEKIPGCVRLHAVPGAETVARALESAILDTRFTAESPVQVARAPRPARKAARA